MRLNDGTSEFNFTLSGGAIIWPTNARLQFTGNDLNGNINRMIAFKSTNDVDRPWISWIDEANRHRVAIGYHTKDAVSGEIHQAFEVKTVASAGGPNPADFRTRLSIGTNAQRVTTSLTYTDAFEVYQGENPFTVLEGAVAPFGLNLRAVPQDTVTAGASNYIAADFIAQLDQNDNATLFIDVKPPYGTAPGTFTGPLGLIPAGNKGANISIFRNTNVPSASNPAINIKKGDGTNTDSVTIVAKTGAMTLLGGIGVFGTTAVAAKPTVSGAKGSNAALGSLLTALVSYGLVTDSTTA